MWATQYIQKLAAKGIPDRSDYGDIAAIPTEQLLPFAVQKHEAERAGLHYDLRLHGAPGDKAYSFALRKGLPEPGQKHLAIPQPLHEGSYSDFEGELQSGYGKGTVTTHEKGRMFVTHASPDKVKFVVASRKSPEMFALVKKPDGNWLLINTTPKSMIEAIGTDIGKAKYVSVPAEKVNKLFSQEYLVQEKIDGASALFHLLNDKIHAISYRTSKHEGRPIVHTYRVFGPAGGKTSKHVPEELNDSVLRGEIYGEQDGKVIPPQQLSGILNATTENALKKQEEQGVKLKAMLFDVAKPSKQLGALERLDTLGEYQQYLPADTFRLPETAATPEEARKLWDTIASGSHPRTSEGIVAWPVEAGHKPIKAKNFPESDVYIRKIFPGEKRLFGHSAGGFEYSLTPHGPIVGRVGTGFSDSTRKDMWQNEEDWIGRVARIHSQQQFAKSKAHRAPAFISLHEDYPTKGKKHK